MKSASKKLTFLAVGIMLTAGALTACASGSGDGSSASSGSGEGAGVKIGLLLPESKTARYEQFDKPLFEAKVAELGDYEVLYSNADQDASKQQQQAESALTSGVKVLVLDPVDAEAAVSIVSAANAQGVPVVSYDRLVAGGDLDYYISFDNEKVGVLQGQAITDKLKEDGSTGGILMVNGSPTDGNATLFKKGAHSVIDTSANKVLAEFDTPDWSPDKAQDWVAGQITQFPGQIAGVYAANDGTAGGAVAALKAANVTPWPVITGQDAELAGIQRIVAGDQYMTIYKAIKAEAEKAAEIAVSLANGETVEGDTDTDGTPTTLLDPVVVTIDNIMDTVVADGFYTVADICTSDYADACAAAGIQ
ncbi:sugar ABC transporter substrate-binding protein [Compostimonas suwonensis]|uniref:D-xylose transport system substrate-binding protein n=1 Tax=Compostimonas suwonensis TaxID=1048394 RepID=A0A2M9BCQ8_9MICO|nr:substrate-binding domain-containing protein [Compostimonas suwonensis]PJJ55712.1 D-xylose transport system substrate-binding protein [Compostimonas suwonensis]